jgi:DNA-binding NarL/FixJ family response regulator
MIKVALAEDIPSLAKAMENKLSLSNDISLKFIAENGDELIKKLEENHAIDVILMDIKMPVKDGIEATKVVQSKWPQIKVIVCTVFDDDEHIFKAILAGASGYIMKDEPPAVVFKSIFEVIEGGAPMSPQIAKKSLQLLRTNAVSQSIENPTESYDLTKRELEILTQLSKGFTYAQIADNLFISQGTVRKHIENIYRKMQVKNKVEAISLAEKNRLVG